jgi:hypothetical protein
MVELVPSLFRVKTISLGGDTDTFSFQDVRLKSRSSRSRPLFRQFLHVEKTDVTAKLSSNIHHHINLRDRSFLNLRHRRASVYAERFYIRRSAFLVPPLTPAIHFRY